MTFQKIYNLFITEQIDTPSITSVEQTDANKIQIKWKLHESSAEITRYRLFYTDSSSYDLNEWPSKQKKLIDIIIINLPFYQL